MKRLTITTLILVLLMQACAGLSLFPSDPIIRARALLSESAVVAEGIYRDVTAMLKGAELNYLQDPSKENKEKLAEVLRAYQKVHGLYEDFRKAHGALRIFLEAYTGNEGQLHTLMEAATEKLRLMTIEAAIK